MDPVWRAVFLAVSAFYGDLAPISRGLRASGVSNPSEGTGGRVSGVVHGGSVSGTVPHQPGGRVGERRENAWIFRHGAIGISPPLLRDAAGGVAVESGCAPVVKD